MKIPAKILLVSAAGQANLLDMPFIGGFPWGRTMFCAAGFFVFTIFAATAIAQPVVSNVRASQRGGTGLVDIYYDLVSASNTLTVSVSISTNAGVAFNAPAASLSGDLGSGKTPGTGKHVVWNAGADLMVLYFPNVKVRVTADDATAPSGMALIPAGSFTMGDSLDGDSSALPLHTVYISAFYMDKYDVTEALWQQVFNWATNHGYSFDYPGSVPGSAYSSYSKGPNYPVVIVDWYDCVKWCNARSEMAGKTPAYYTSAAQTVVYRTGQVNVDNSSVKWNSGYRLATEAEWEKAARGGLSGQRFPWGNTINESQANYYAYPSSYAYDVNSYSGYNTNFNTGNIYTSPVNYFAPNGYGLYDMAGNVWQWCWDWYGSYGSASQTDPRGAASGSYRVNRGGGWHLNALDCRTANRNLNSPANNDIDIGFRSILPPGQ
jgi:formylglycine-generating enzyme required for sulfatase activity